MKNTAFSLIAICIFFVSCSKEESNEYTVTEKIELNTDYFSKNVAVADARIRFISDEEYVRELILVDFNELKNIPNLLGFQNEVLADNGEGFDQVSGDNIYTSTISYKDSSKKYENENLTSVLEKPIVGSKFLYEDKLAKYLDDNDLNKKSSLEDIKTRGWFVTCDVEWRGCEYWGWECAACVIFGSGTGCISTVCRIGWEQ